jgi:bifunctional non-homologous end joining protein LigD
MADDRQVSVGGREFTLTHPDKVLFPADGYTKADLVAYYRRVADVMVPHLRGRPLMLQRLPDGIGGEGFYQKEVGDYFPEWIRRVEVSKEGGTVTHVVCDDEATIAYLAGQACITPHVWLSRADRIEYPDRLVFDLDPSRSDFAAVRATARELRELLDKLGLVPFVQTTGSRGLHVVVPLDSSADFDAVRTFARTVADRVAAADPDQRTTEARKAKRRGRIYIDIMRNAYAQTAVAPYSVRARPGAPVATPLDWRELGRVTARRYTVANLARRLARRTDPWHDIDRHARPLKRASDALDDLERGRSRPAG